MNTTELVDEMIREASSLGAKYAVMMGCVADSEIRESMDSFPGCYARDKAEADRLHQLLLLQLHEIEDAGFADLAEMILVNVSRNADLAQSIAARKLLRATREVA